MFKKDNVENVLSMYTSDMGPREFTNIQRLREDDGQESSKENSSKDSRIMVKLGAKDSIPHF